MTREEIAAIDRECEELHIGQQDYLESHEIAKHQYYRWKRKYREEDERSQVPAGFVPMMPWSGSRPVHASPEVQRQTTEASGAGKLPDSGDPHVLQFCDAHQGNMTAAHLLQGPRCRDQAMARGHFQTSSQRKGYHGATPGELAASDSKVTVNDSE